MLLMRAARARLLRAPAPSGRDSPATKLTILSFPQYVGLRVEIGQTAPPTLAPTLGEEEEEQQQLGEETRGRTMEDTKGGVGEGSGSGGSSVGRGRGGNGGVDRAVAVATVGSESASGAAPYNAIAGVRLRVTDQNECGARVVQVQACANPQAAASLGICGSWLNVTDERTLCCSPDWQWLPFGLGAGPGTLNGSAPWGDLHLPAAVEGPLVVLRVVLFGSFGNPHRIALNGLQVLATPPPPPGSPTVAPTAAPAIAGPTATPAALVGAAAADASRLHAGTSLAP